MFNENRLKNPFCNANKKTLVLFFIGMAGSGKTTLVYRMSLDLSYLKKDHYIIIYDDCIVFHYYYYYKYHSILKYKVSIHIFISN